VQGQKRRDGGYGYEVSQSAVSPESDVGYVQCVCATLPVSVSNRYVNAAGACAKTYTFTPRLQKDATVPGDDPVFRSVDDSTIAEKAAAVKMFLRCPSAHVPDARSHVNVHDSRE
jgi:hypothetical protein